MLNEEKIKVMNRKELVKELQFHIKKGYEIGEKLGHTNIFEKAKWKEEIMGLILGDTVFTKSTGDVKGADATNDETGNVREYKTEELKTDKDKERFFESVVDGTNTYAGSMTYNNGYSRENVNSYKDIKHFHGVFYRGDVVAITDVSTDYVTSDNGLMKRVLKSENGKKYKSTNGNGVGVHYENGGVRNGEGEVVFLDDIRK
jgi:hypothetical protein